MKLNKIEEYLSDEHMTLFTLSSPYIKNKHSDKTEFVIDTKWKIINSTPNSFVTKFPKINNTRLFYKGIFGMHVNLYDYDDKSVYLDIYFHNNILYSEDIENITIEYIINAFDKIVGDLVGGEDYIKWKIKVRREGKIDNIMG
jgi:hypothetical protein